MPNEPTPVRFAYMIVVGVAPRCRKIERHHVKLGMHPADVDHDTMIAEARARLADYRKVERAVLHLDLGTYHRRDDGMTITQCALMDPAHVRIAL